MIVAQRLPCPRGERTLPAVGRCGVTALLFIAVGFAGAACGTSTPGDCSISESVDLAAPATILPPGVRAATSFAMPTLTNSSASTALAELRTAGWTATAENFYIRYFGACSPREVGVVRDQRPVAGARVASNTPVVVSVGSPRS